MLAVLSRNVHFLRLSWFDPATGRKLGGAVVRNRIRRRIRETLRVMAPALQPGWDVLLIARPAIVDAGQASIAATLRRLLERDGILEGNAT